MKLAIKERLTIPKYLPEKGGYIQQVQVKSIREKIDLISAEIEEYKVKDTEDGFVVWDVLLAKDIEVDFTQGEKEVLNLAIDNMDAAGEITQDNLEMCEKIKSLIK